MTKSRDKTDDFLGQSVDDLQKNSHITCPHCKKNIIPRALTSNGVIVKTYCPFCLQTIQEVPISKFAKIFGIALVSIVLWVLIFVWFGPIILAFFK